MLIYIIRSFVFDKINFECCESVAILTTFLITMTNYFMSSKEGGEVHLTVSMYVRYDNRVRALVVCKKPDNVQFLKTCRPDCLTDQAGVDDLGHGDQDECERSMLNWAVH